MEAATSGKGRSAGAFNNNVGARSGQSARLAATRRTVTTGRESEASPLPRCRLPHAAHASPWGPGATDPRPVWIAAAGANIAVIHATRASAIALDNDGQINTYALLHTRTEQSAARRQARDPTATRDLPTATRGSASNCLARQTAQDHAATAPRSPRGARCGRRAPGQRAHAL